LFRTKTDPVQENHRRPRRSRRHAVWRRAAIPVRKLPRLGVKKAHPSEAGPADRVCCVRHDVADHRAVARLRKRFYAGRFKVSYGKRRFAKTGSGQS
jgi:hypothetical protein